MTLSRPGGGFQTAVQVVMHPSAACSKDLQLSGRATGCSPVGHWSGSGRVLALLSQKAVGRATEGGRSLTWLRSQGHTVKRCVCDGQARTHCLELVVEVEGV